MKKAIIVEDNLLIAVVYRHYLEKMNYEIISEVTTGEMAIEVLSSEKVDIIIMDIMLNGIIDGIDAMIEIRNHSNSPVIFASGNSDALNMNRASEISNSMFLIKPVTDDDFTKAVHKMTETKKPA
ncbi:MAG: response regulator [Balneola sp.]|nr:response regulator [Balneola sp.]MBO6652283.1 response regulator [Balneola sp.]MBO6712721.1 response regulator [Balneola sp.]MBO6801383.1 response regulator [Balneola sp.]MBO6870458.1 response regulator [Balneola sp.]